jgi:hypothetical protein
MWYREVDHIGVIYFWNQYEFVRYILGMHNLENRPVEQWAQQEIDRMLWEKALDY